MSPTFEKKSSRSSNWKKWCKSSCICVVIPIVLLCLCPIVLLGVGFGVAMPYIPIQHFSQQLTTCTVTRVEDKGTSRCDCGKGDFKCYSNFPCMMIYVNYTDIGSDENISNAELYGDPYEYFILKDEECSVKKCNRDAEGNSQFVEKFVTKYGTPGQQFPCYPGKPSDPEVLLSVIYLWPVLLGLLLPATLFVVAAISLFVYCVIYPRCKDSR